MKQFVKCPICNSVELYDESGNGMLLCKNCDNYILPQDIKLLKAISIRQPWAWLIVNGYKDLENRSTLKNFRGDVLIHASAKIEKDWWENCSDKLRDHITKNIQFNHGPQKLGQYKSGGIVGVATFTGSVTESDSPWFVGPNAFTIENAKPLPFTPCKGALGFFNPKID